MSLIELKVPDIGGHENVDIIAVEVNVGDTIAVDDTLITLETDKATAMSCTDALSVSNTTCASSLAKFTPASATKSFLFNTFSMREAQA